MTHATGQMTMNEGHPRRPGIVSLISALLVVLAVPAEAGEPFRDGGHLAYPLLEKELDTTSPKLTTHHAHTATGLSVDHLTRQYETDNPGLTINVPDGYLTVSTAFENGHWSLDPARVDLDGQAAEWSGLSFYVLQAD